MSSVPQLLKRLPSQVSPDAKSPNVSMLTPPTTLKVYAAIATIVKAATNWRPNANTLTGNCTRAASAKPATYECSNTERVPTLPKVKKQKMHHLPPAARPNKNGETCKSTPK